MLTACIRIYVIHISAIIAIALSTYYPGLDIILSILYVLIVFGEANFIFQKIANIKKQALIALIWQLPGLLLVLQIFDVISLLELLQYYDLFILEIWHTPLLPILSLLPACEVLEKPLYYYVLFILIPFLLLLYFSPVVVELKKNKNKI